MKRLLFISMLALGFSVAEVSALPVRDSLAMVETGARDARPGAADRIRGAAGEVSRFQILPSIWQQYSKSRDYENPEVAWTVAQRILADRSKAFRGETGREPNALELYLLWHKPSTFRSAGFTASRVNKLYRQRAERFANLVASL